MNLTSQKYTIFLKKQKNVEKNGLTYFLKLSEKIIHLHFYFISHYHAIIKFQIHLDILSALCMAGSSCAGFRPANAAANGYGHQKRPFGQWIDLLPAV